MIDMAQCDRTLRQTDNSVAGIYIVVHDDNTILGIDLTYNQAAKIVYKNELCATMIRTN
jgi:hypothetical protein